MADFIKNIIWNSVEGYVEAGTRSAGEFAGNALIKAGDAIEGGGRGVGNGIEKKASGLGLSIAGQTYAPSPKPRPSSARKPAVKRANSLPASSNKPTAAGNKYPGANQVAGSTKKAVTRGASTASGGVGGAAATTTTTSTGSVTSGAQKALSSVPAGFKGASAKGYATSNNLPKPYGGNAFSSSGSVSGAPKSAVRPGQSKPFTPPPVEQKRAGNGAKKACPGTNTLPGQASRVPVQKMKALPRLGPQVGQGQKMTHISV